MTDEWLIEEGKNGPKIVLTGAWSKRVCSEILDRGIKEIELNSARGWKDRDISFLSELPHLESVVLIRLQLDSTLPLGLLHELRHLSISSACKDELDFDNWPELESFGLDEWHLGAASIYSHRGVKDLFINKWNHGENLSGFSGMEQLRSLRLYSPTRLVSLSGIEPLTNLTCIEIALARKLESISGVEGLSRLRVLGLHTCKKIRSGPGKRSQLAGYDLPVPVRQAT